MINGTDNNEWDKVFKLINSYNYLDWEVEWMICLVQVHIIFTSIYAKQGWFDWNESYARCLPDINSNATWKLRTIYANVLLWNLDWMIEMEVKSLNRWLIDSEEAGTMRRLINNQLVFDVHWLLVGDQQKRGAKREKERNPLKSKMLHAGIKNWEPPPPSNLHTHTHTHARAHTHTHVEPCVLCLDIFINRLQLTECAFLPVNCIR